jgi:hypothetical protein
MIPDELALAGPDAARLADELLRTGRPFHAHEVLEASWKSAAPDERDLWQGLAQVAVGLTHAHRGNARGAVTLLRRGADRVRAYRDAAEASAPDAAEVSAPDAAEASAGGGRPYGLDITTWPRASNGGAWQAFRPQTSGRACWSQPKPTRLGACSPAASGSADLSLMDLFG